VPVESGPDRAPGRGLCPVCAIGGAEDADEELRAQLFVAYQAERFGGKYIQLCPHSLLFWAAPILDDGIMAAALIGGPVMVVETEELLEELLSSGKIPAGGEKEARAALESTPRVAPQRASSLAELLRDVASPWRGPRLSSRSASGKSSSRGSPTSSRG